MRTGFIPGTFTFGSVQTTKLSILTDVIDDAICSDAGYEMLQITSWTTVVKDGPLNPYTTSSSAPSLLPAGAVRNGNVPFQIGRLRSDRFAAVRLIPEMGTDS